MSTNYSFVKTPEEIAGALSCAESADFFQQERISLYWTVDEALARKVLPPHMTPWMPFGVPIMTAYIAFFGRPEFLYPYTEGALFMLAESEGRKGVYCFAMPLDGNDQAMDSGREFFGYPKKQAYVKLERKGDKITGFIERNDVRFFEAEFTIGGELNNTQIGPYAIGADGPQQSAVDVLLLKYAMDSAVGDSALGNFRDPRILAQKNLIDFKEKKAGHVDRITVRPSEDDPWIELAPASEQAILGGYYAKFDSFMKPAELVYTYDPAEYESLLPYMWCAWDTSIMGKEHSSHRTENFWR